jgi:glycosyltransferase involved in cell wall biosynthesis
VNEHPTVSVIIPAYNREVLIRQTLDSVLAQTYDDFQVLVADDGSTDGTLAVLRVYEQTHPDRIRVLPATDGNRGAATTVNRLLDEATGEFIAYLDSDDYWLPDKLAKQVAYMRAHPDVVYSFHDVEYIDGETLRSMGMVSEIVGRGRGRLRGGDVRATLDPKLAMSSPSVMVRRDAVGSTRRDTRFRVSEDLLWDVDILAKGGKLGAINEVLAVYRKHANNISRSGYFATRGTEEMLMLLAVVEARYPYLSGATRPYRRKTLITAITQAVAARDNGTARTIALNSVRSGLGIRPLGIYLTYALFYQRLKNMPLSAGLTRRIARLIYR